MSTFEEKPQVVFEVKDGNGVVIYRDAIVYDSVTALRNDSTAERQAKFQQRYDAYLEKIANLQIETSPEGA